MKVYLLWFNEWEANYVLGVFETKEQAEKWQSYFVANPICDGWIASSMEHYVQKEPNTWTDRFEIEERTLGQIHPEIKVDNLKYVEHLFTESENASKIDRSEPTEG
jgi:hypothetical protein